MSPIADGIVTAAFGARRYLEMAVDLALSVHDASRLPISLVTSESGADFVRSHYPDLFERIIAEELDVGPSGADAYLSAKLACLEVSPYRRSIFLDADMICVKDPSYLLDGLSDDEVRVHGRLHDKSSCGALEHHRIKIADLLDGLGLDSYVWCSLAAFAFDYEGARRLARLINAERQVWSNKLRARFNAPLNDEIMLGVLGRRSGVSFFWYPERSYQDQTMSFRWSNTFTFVHPAPMRNREALRVVAGVLSRRKRAGFSLEPTLYWLSEIFSRRALLAGRSRRQASVIRRLVRWRLEQVAEMV